MNFLRKAYAYTGVAAAAAGTLMSGRAYGENNRLTNDSSIGITGSSNFNDGANNNIQSQIVKIAQSVLSVVLLLSGVLAVLYLVYSGVQYITSAGNPDKIKTARAGIINAIIGIVIIVAAFFIIRC